MVLLLASVSQASWCPPGPCRSAYFRLGHLLKQKVQARCVLALTATATRATEAEVATALDIQPENRLRDSNMRDNLRLSVVHHNGGELGSQKRITIQALSGLQHICRQRLPDACASK